MSDAMLTVSPARRTRKFSIKTPHGSPSPTCNQKGSQGSPSPSRSSHNTWQHGIELRSQAKYDDKYLSADQLWVDNAVKVSYTSLI